MFSFYGFISLSMIYIFTHMTSYTHEVVFVESQAAANHKIPKIKLTFEIDRSMLLLYVCIPIGRLQHACSLLGVKQE
jgi:hypothetical protein